MRAPSRIVSSIYGGAADFTDHIGAIAPDPLRARTLLRRFPPLAADPRPPPSRQNRTTWRARQAPSDAVGRALERPTAKTSEPRGVSLK